MWRCGTQNISERNNKWIHQVARRNIFSHGLRLRQYSRIVCRRCRRPLPVAYVELCIPSFIHDESDQKLFAIQSVEPSAVCARTGGLTGRACAANRNSPHSCFQDRTWPNRPNSRLPSASRQRSRSATGVPIRSCASTDPHWRNHRQ